MNEQLEERLADWVASGLLGADQVAPILAHEQRTRGEGAGTGRGPLVAEAVGYLGAVLTLVAGALVVEEFWDQLAPWARVVLTGVLSLALLLAGWALRHRPHPAVQRLTSVLWFTATIGVAFTAGMAADERQLSYRVGALAVSAVVAVVAASLYAMRRTGLQLLAMSGGVAATAVSALAVPRASVDPLFVGLVLYGLGIAWTLLALGGWLVPRRWAAALGLLAAGIGCQVGATGRHEEVAILAALATAVLIIWASVRLDDTLVLGFGVAGVFVFAPQAVFRFFGDSIGAPLALLLTGLLLVATAVGMVTLRRSITEETS